MLGVVAQVTEPTGVALPVAVTIWALVSAVGLLAGYLLGLRYGGS